MLSAIISLLAIFIFLAIVEVYWRKKHLANETSRQLVHIVVGTFVAFWPYYMSYRSIFFCAIAFLIVIVLGRTAKSIKTVNWPKLLPFKVAARELNFIESIHEIERKSWGDLIFPITIGFLALFEPDKYIFTIAMLNVGLADGLASFVGCRFGKTKQYKVFEQKKSLYGTLTFLVVSAGIIVAMKVLAPTQTAQMSWLTLIYLPPLLTLTENFASFGTDDFMIPLMVLVTLSWF